MDLRTASNFDNDGFERRFLELFAAAMRPATRILRSRSEAEDVASEVLARVYVDWERLGAAEWLHAWIARCSANLAIDHVRRARRQVPPRIATGPTGDLELRWDLAEAVAKLPRRQRETVGLRYFADMSEADVAALLGVSVGSVKTHLHRAMGTLRRQLGTAWEDAVARC